MIVEQKSKFIELTYFFRRQAKKLAILLTLQQIRRLKFKLKKKITNINGTANLYFKIKLKSHKTQLKFSKLSKIR